MLKVLRFLCVCCSHTLSVLDSNQLPYWSLPASDVQESFDLRSGIKSAGEDPPLSEIKKARLNSAWRRLFKRASQLRLLLGQIIPAKASVSVLWTKLRDCRGDLPAILCFLGANFKISLLGDYRCLKPWIDTS